MKAKEISQKLNIKEEEFKTSWQWLANFRCRRGLKSMHLFGEGAEVDKDDPVLLQQLKDLYSVINMYRENVYNIDETGLFFHLLSRYSLLMLTESLVTTRGKKKSKEIVTLAVCSNATGSNKIPCSMIGKAA
ncbi:jerky protein homolog-like [Hydra vulgaris]|uniref:Jerky protein homolog-like n=1 Tax=Hydra vulgaris TaxID=6087 RepID=A0ABM4D1C8_HYDVU